MFDNGLSADVYSARRIDRDANSRPAHIDLEDLAVALAEAGETWLGDDAADVGEAAARGILHGAPRLGDEHFERGAIRRAVAESECPEHHRSRCVAAMFRAWKGAR